MVLVLVDDDNPGAVTEAQSKERLFVCLFVSKVTDMMLQDTHYPDWGRTARHLWRQGHNRIVLFW